MYERINNYISDWEISPKTGFTTSPSVLFILKDFQLKVLLPLTYQPITLCQICSLMHINHYNLHIIVQFLYLFCFIKYSETFWRDFFNPTPLFKAECWLEHIPPIDTSSLEPENKYFYLCILSTYHHVDHIEYTAVLMLAATIRFGWACLKLPAQKWKRKLITSKSKNQWAVC